MTDERDPHDLYETPFEAVESLIVNLWVGGTDIGKVWDPSCGRGAIVKAMLEQSYVRCGRPTSYHRQEVVGWDKYAYQILEGINRNHIRYFVDFLSLEMRGGIPVGTKTIVMNPPYSQADAHVRHAIKLIPDNGFVCVLLRWNWITAKKRRDLLPYIHKMIIVGRLKMLPPGVEDRGHSGTVDFCWFVFTKLPLQRLIDTSLESPTLICRPEIVRA